MTILSYEKNVALFIENGNAQPASQKYSSLFTQRATYRVPTHICAAMADTVQHILKVLQIMCCYRGILEKVLRHSCPSTWPKEKEINQSKQQVDVLE